MKKHFLQSSLLITLFSTMISYSLGADQPLNLAIGNWEPFTSERFESSRLLEGLVREAFAQEGLDVVFSYYPWKRSYEEVRSGRRDGTFPWTRTDERDRDFLFSNESIMVEENVFFHLKDNAFDWTDFDDLRDLKIGGTLGYGNAKMLEDMGIAIDWTQNEEFNFHKLLARRIDVYPASSKIGYFLIDLLFDEDNSALFTHHPKPLMVKEYYLLVSRQISNGPEIIEKFDLGLKKLKDSGRYVEIMAALESDDL